MLADWTIDDKTFGTGDEETPKPARSTGKSRSKKSRSGKSEVLVKAQGKGVEDIRKSSMQRPSTSKARERGDQVKSASNTTVIQPAPSNHHKSQGTTKFQKPITRNLDDPVSQESTAQDSNVSRKPLENAAGTTTRPALKILSRSAVPSSPEPILVQSSKEISKSQPSVASAKVAESSSMDKATHPNRIVYSTNRNKS